MAQTERQTGLRDPLNRLSANPFCELPDVEGLTLEDCAGGNGVSRHPQKIRNDDQGALTRPSRRRSIGAAEFIYAVDRAVHVTLHSTVRGLAP